MLFVLEGPEATGKTTLSNHLTKECGFMRYRAMMNDHRLTPGETRFWHSAGVPVNTLADDHYTADLLAKLHRSGRDVSRVLLDRSMPSGLAYDKRIHTSPFPPEQSYMWHMEKWRARMAELDAVIIWLDGDTDTLLERLPRDDSRRSREHIDMIRSRLDHVMGYAGNLRVVRVDTTNLTPDQVIEHLKKVLIQRNPWRDLNE